MALSNKTRLTHGKMPRDIEYEMTPVHVKKVWELLEEKFAFNTGAWKKEFKAYYEKQPRTTQEMEAFYDFGFETIQPVLNQILKRDPWHPTWRSLLLYIVRKN